MEIMKLRDIRDHGRLEVHKSPYSALAGYLGGDTLASVVDEWIHWWFAQLNEMAESLKIVLMFCPSCTTKE